MPQLLKNKILESSPTGNECSGHYQPAADWIEPQGRDRRYNHTILEKQLDGFGELFRYLTYQELGTASIMSRATAGVHQRQSHYLFPGRWERQHWRWIK